MRKKLARGGSAVALMLDGDLILESPTDPQEKRILNVVEEMAIASGCPVPLVFVLNRQGSINAFAAGYTKGDAVIGVTRGSLELLTRDELQGVIAHEFSHIMNGDMKLNLELTSILHGLLAINTIGAWLIRVALRVRAGAWSLALTILGTALRFSGLLGVFFGKWIKAAVSRQREFLADASAVQFTRNPQGIATALKKIGGLKTGSQISHYYATAMSHIFFGNALKPAFLDFLSTHPPLSERIRAIDPSFDGRFPIIQPIALPPLQQPKTSSPGINAANKIAVIAALSGNEFGKRVGNPTMEDLDYAKTFLSELPDQLLPLARQSFTVPILVYALLLDENGEIRSVQINYIREKIGEPVANEVSKVYLQLSPLGPGAKLPLVELSFPALRNLSLEQFQFFAQHVSKLTRLDEKVSVFEFMLEKLLIKDLEVNFKKAKPKGAKYFSIRPLLPDCEALLSIVAYTGQPNFERAKSAFSNIGHHLGSEALHMIPQKDLNFEILESALDRLAGAIPAIRKKVMEAAILCAKADDRLTVKEGELLRAIASVLDCPLPPIWT